MKKTIQLSSGHDLRYYTNGGAKDTPIVLLHGFCESSRMWTDILPFLKDKKVIRIDLPGFGGSSPIKNASMKIYADAIHKVLNVERVDTCMMLGHSMGGYAALAFAEKYSKRLASIGLIHSHPFEDSISKKEERYRTVALLRKGGKKTYLRMLFSALFTPEFVTENEVLIKKITAAAEQGPTEGIVDALRAMAMRPDRSEILRALNIPVFMALGTEDNLLPKVTENTMLSMPSITDLQVWENVAHMSMYECPEKLGVAISKFHIFAAQMHVN